MTSRLGKAGVTTRNALTSLPDISELATDLLTRSGQSRPPVSLKCLLSLWPDLKVSFDQLDGEGYLVNLGARGGHVIVNRDRPRVRQRFSIGHEIGHWVLWELEGEPATSAAGVVHRATVERWCDKFSTELLMPGEWVKRDIAAVPFRRLADFVWSLPSCYYVSRQAMYIRISELTNLSLFEIAARGDSKRLVQRYRSSQRAGVFGGLAKCLTELPTGSASKVIQGNGGGDYVARPVYSTEAEHRWLVVGKPTDCSVV